MSPSSSHPTGLAPLHRRRGWLDPLLAEVDRALQVLSGTAAPSRPNPAGPQPAPAAAEPLPDAERRHAAGLMRVDHVGEICAQALYRGQAAVCRDEATTRLLHQAAQEETDHLVWCGQRLAELGSRPSLFNPLWYAGSFGLGLLAGKAGVPRNLGFMAETERQVEDHLADHLRRLPAADVRSRRILEQMKEDEVHHRVTAERAGAARLPGPVRLAMRLMSRVMTTTAYRI